MKILVSFAPVLILSDIFFCLIYTFDLSHCCFNFHIFTIKIKKNLMAFLDFFLVESLIYSLYFIT